MRTKKDGLTISRKLHINSWLICVEIQAGSGVLISPMPFESRAKGEVNEYGE